MNAHLSPPIAPPVQRSRPSWSRRLFSGPVILGLVLVYLVVYGAAAHGVADPDIWWHLRHVRELLATGHFPHADTWTFTVAGQPWINFEWMAELPYYLAWKVAGDLGLYAVMTALVAAIALGTYWLAWLRSRDWFASFLAALAATSFYMVSLAPRTLLFGWLFLVVELAILWELREGRDRTLWLPPLFLLWINTHGSWFIGWVLMVVFFACGWIEGEWGRLYAQRWSAAQRRRLLWVTAATVLVLFANPYGWRLAAYPFDVIFHQKQTMEYVAEWASLDFHSRLGKEFLVVLLGFGVLQIVRPKRWLVQDLLFCLIAVYGALTHVRFVFLAGIVIAPMLAVDLKLPPAASDEKPKDLRPAAAVLVVLLLVLIAIAIPRPGRLRAGVAAYVPEQALPWVRSIAGKGNLFNDFDWGGYFELEAPQTKYFIDSRVDIFVHHGEMSDYARAVDGHATFAVLDKYRIRYALLPSGSPMAYMLEHNAAWKVLWKDPQAEAFERAR